MRDLLLGIAPQDYDIATNARPQDVMSLFPDTLAVGAQFGVVLVVIKTESVEDDKPIHVEVATYRSDVGYSDGRHPDEVRFTRDPREITSAGVPIWNAGSSALSASRTSAFAKISCA